MAIRTLTYALAALGLTVAATAQAAAPVAVPARSSAPVAEAEQLGGSPGLIPVLVAVLAILSIIVLEGDDDDDLPVSP